MVCTSWWRRMASLACLLAFGCWLSADTATGPQYWHARNDIEKSVAPTSPRTFVAWLAQDRQWPVRADDLVESGAEASLTGVHTRFRLSLGGREVVNAFVDLHSDASGAVRSAAWQLPRAAQPLSASVPDPNGAWRLAVADFLAHGAYLPPDPRRAGLTIVVAPYLAGDREVLYLADGELVAARELVLACDRPSARVAYWVGGAPARLLDYCPLYRFVDGSGKVFQPNPVNALNNTALRPDMPESAFTAAYSTVVLRELAAPVDGKYSLTGPYVKIVSDPSEPPGVPPPAETSPVFQYTRTAPGFGAVMAYYWLDTAGRYIRSLGYADLMNYQVPVDVHGLDGQDNSYFMPHGDGTGNITYGDGGVPDSEDADVVLHEYGHAIQDNSRPNYFYPRGESGAIGEGFGDYWTFSLTYALSVAHQFDPDCMAEWDSIYFTMYDPPCMRRMDSPKIYPRDLAGEVHADGEMWARLLRDVFHALGKDNADKLVLESHFNMPFTPTFLAGSIAMLDAEDTLFHGAHRWPLFDALAARGFIRGGDLNANKKCDTQDLVILSQYVTGNINLGQGLFTNSLWTADMNRDNHVDALDLVALAAALAE